MKYGNFNLIVILFMLTTLVGGCGRQTALEGSWIGCDIRKPLIDWTLAVQGDKFILIREDSNVWYKGRFKLNNNCVRKKIDFEIDEAHARAQDGKALFGIYEINNDTLTFVISKPGRQSRPLTFDEPNEAMVYNFVRS